MKREREVKIRRNESKSPTKEEMMNAKSNRIGRLMPRCKRKGKSKRRKEHK